MTVNSVDQSCSLPYVIVYIGIAIMDKLNRYVSVFLICVGFFCKRILLFAVIGQSILLLNTFVYNLKFVGRKSTVVRSIFIMLLLLLSVTVNTANPLSPVVVIIGAAIT